MVTFKEYVKAASLEEAYQMNQKRGNVILGGMLWMKMSRRNLNCAIDLDGLGLNTIEEEADQFVIGAMCSLRDLEQNLRVHECFGGVIRASLKHIVGVQFRNCATIGGTIFGRYGFSDLLTCLLVLDTWVELYKGGLVPLREFIKMPRDYDILVRIRIRKESHRAVYQSFRRSWSDLPILNMSASVDADRLLMAVGARPMKADLIEMDLKDVPEQQEKWMEFAQEIAGRFQYGSNMRGGAKYREHLAAVSICRAVKVLQGGSL